MKTYISRMWENTDTSNKEEKGNNTTSTLEKNIIHGYKGSFSIPCTFATLYQKFISDEFD